MTAESWLDAAREVHGVVVEETGQAFHVDKAQVAIPASKTPFDEIAWRSRQLGRPLSRD